MAILLFTALLLAGIIIALARKIDNKLLRYLVIAISLIFVIAITGMIWSVVDWLSPRHWVGVYSVVDASQQKEGLAEFILPSGDYAIVASRDDYKTDDKLIIAYELDIPRERIKVVNKKEINLRSVQNYLMENIKIRNNMVKGVLRVKILFPSKGKVSVGLVTDRFGGM
ncbi:MAG: hypothetical protein PHT50_06545 [Candidatus Omnitrophica bacterium]|nr:hypothetical protein [Candidatus Omnitrophota bacterium]